MNITSKIGCWLLLCWVPLVLNAQNPSRADSLLQVLSRLPADADTAHLNARAKVLSQLGSYFYKQNNYTQGRAYYRQNLAIEHQLADPRGIAQGLNNVAYTYLVEGRYPEALDTFLMAYDQWALVRDTGKMATAATSISNIYREMPGNAHKELEYARRCMVLTERARRWHGLCACTHLVGDILDQMNRPDSAEYYIRRSLQLMEQRPDWLGLSTLYLSMGRIEQRRGQYANALVWIQKAVAYQQHFAQNYTPDQWANAYLHLADVYLRLHQPAQAAPLLQQVRSKWLPSIPDLTYHERLYGGLSQLADMQGRPADALQYYKMQVAARDSVVNLDNAKRIAQIQLTHEFEKKQAADQAQQQQALALRDAQTRQQRWVFALLLMALAGGAALYFYISRQRQARQRAQLELANLRAQINPHFIFNCLNSIYRYTKEGDTDTAAHYLQKFSRLLRLVLENSRSEKISLSSDLEALQLYVEIERLRFKDKLRFELELDPEVDPSFVQVPGMLLQPYVENAIWHGLLHRPEGGLITVRIRHLSETLLRVEVEDNGIGRAAAAAMKRKNAPTHKGLGQKITEERLKSTGKMAQSQTIDLVDNQGNPLGTKVLLDIPL